MRILIAFVNIVLALLMALFAISALNNYFSENQHKLDNYLLLKTDGIETSFIAEGDFIVAENRDNDDTNFTLHYSFKVIDDLYKGNYQLEDTVGFDKQGLKGTFLIENPNINAVDIDKKINKIEAQIEGKEDLKWGLIAALLSVLLFFLGIRSIKLHKAKKS